MKIIKTIAGMAALILLFVGCEAVSQNADTDGSITVSDNSTESQSDFCKDNLVDFDEIDTINFKGLKYSQVKQMMGSDGKDIGSGVVIMKWDLPDGRTLKVWLSDWGDSYENGIVSKYVIE